MQAFIIMLKLQKQQDDPTETYTMKIGGGEPCDRQNSTRKTGSERFR
jgi:hypothetical protein